MAADPLLAAFFLKAKAHHAERKPFRGRYRDLLEWSLAHRWWSLGFGVLLFVGSVGLASLLPTGFTPPCNPTSIVFDVAAAPGTTRDEMERSVAEVTRLLRRQPDVRLVFARAGGQDFTPAP